MLRLIESMIGVPLDRWHDRARGPKWRTEPRPPAGFPFDPWCATFVAQALLSPKRRMPAHGPLPPTAALQPLPERRPTAKILHEQSFFSKIKFRKGSSNQQLAM